MSCLARWLEEPQWNSNPGQKPFNEILEGLWKDENSPIHEENFCEGDPVIDALVENYGADENAWELKHNYDCAIEKVLPLVRDKTARAVLGHFTNHDLDFLLIGCAGEGTTSVTSAAEMETVMGWLEGFIKMAGYSSPRLIHQVKVGTCIWNWVQTNSSPTSTLGQLRQWADEGGLEEHGCGDHGGADPVVSAH